MKPTNSRKSLRETMQDNQKAMDMWAAAFGKPKVSLGAIPEPRKRQPSESSAPLEKDIQKAILQALKLHPKVAFIGRFNSGTSSATDANGQTRYIRYNTLPGFPDLHGCLKGGRALYIEAKRPGGKVSDDQREFLARAKQSGAAAGVAYSVEEAIKIVEE